MGIFTEQRAPALVRRIRRYFPNVNRVADSKAPLKIVVKECDVEKAKKKSENHCAMALACQRDSGCDGAIIRPTVAFVIRGDLAVKYDVPHSVQREIVSFDRHRDFRPGEYQLSAVVPTHRIGYNRGKASVNKLTGKFKHRRPIISHMTQGMRGVTPHDGV